MRGWAVADDWTIGFHESAVTVERKGRSSDLAVGSDLASEMQQLLSSSGPFTITPALSTVLDRLVTAGAIVRTVAADGIEHATHHRSSVPRSEFGGPVVADSGLLPNVFMRRLGQNVEVIGGQYGDRLVLRTAAAREAATALFASPSDLGCFGLELQSMFYDAGMYRDESNSPRFENWDPHDSVFHLMVRMDSSQGPYGGREPDRRRPVPPVRRPKVSEGLLLERSIWSAGTKSPLSSLIQARETLRKHGPIPLHVNDLAFVLEGSLGIREIQYDSTIGEQVHRPTPNGGGKTGLGAIVVVQDAIGLLPGVFEYNGIDHGLHRISGLSEASARRLQMAGRLSSTTPASIHCLILFTLDYSRPRLAYDSIIYATALKEVGAAMQSMALASAERGLAFAPLGGGFGTVSDLDPSLSELAVIGEATLGHPASKADRHEL